jgi:hypothetical protein
MIPSDVPDEVPRFRFDVGVPNEVGWGGDLVAGVDVSNRADQAKPATRLVKGNSPIANRMAKSPASAKVFAGVLGVTNVIWSSFSDASTWEYPIFAGVVFVWIPIFLLLFAIKVGLEVGDQ